VDVRDNGRDVGGFVRVMFGGGNEMGRRTYDDGCRLCNFADLLVLLHDLFDASLGLVLVCRYCGTKLGLTTGNFVCLFLCFIVAGPDVFSLQLTLGWLLIT
jgi:hypothetical protein